jgi:hypothetical protein
MPEIVQMQAPSGAAVSSYELMSQVQLVLDPMIFTNTPLDTPLQSALNSVGFPILGSGPINTRTYWWQEEDIPTPRARLVGAMDNTTDPVAVNVEAGEAAKFAIGDAIRIDNEILLITAVVDSDTLTATRAQGGTTIAAHQDDDDVIGLGTLLAEGEIGGGVATDRFKNFNYTKIFTRSLSFTRTGQIIPKVGVPSELAKQMFANQHAVQMSKEQAYLYAIRYNSDVAEKRSFGGVFDMVRSHVNTTDTSLTVSVIETAQENLFIDGFSAGSLWSHPVNFKPLNDLANTNIVRVTFEDARRGRQRVEMVETEYGSVTLVRNRWMRASDAFLAPDGSSGAGLKKLVMTPLSVEKLAKTKDRDDWMMVCEEGFEIKGQRGFTIFTGLTGAVRISIPTSEEVVPAAHRHGPFQGPSGYEGDYPN